MRPYRTNRLLADNVQVILNCYLAPEIISHSSFPWAFPPGGRSKENCKARLTVNYQRLNTVTTAPHLPLPRIDEIIDCLGRGNLFSTFDMQSRYHQMVMDPGFIEMMAFCTPSGLHE